MIDLVLASSLPGHEKDLFDYGIFQVGVRFDNEQSPRDGGKITFEIPASAKKNLLKIRSVFNDATKEFLENLGFPLEFNPKFEDFDGLKVVIDFKSTKDKQTTLSINTRYELQMTNSNSEEGDVQLSVRGTVDDRILEKGLRFSLKISPVSQEPVEVECELGDLLSRDQTLIITHGDTKLVSKFYLQKQDMFLKVKLLTKEFEYYIKAKVYNDDDDDIDLWRPTIFLSKSKIMEDGTTELLSKYKFILVQERGSFILEGSGTLEGQPGHDAIFKPGTEMWCQYNRTSEDKGGDYKFQQLTTKAFELCLSFSTLTHMEII